MKKIIPKAVVAIGIITLAACTASPENAIAENGSDMMAPNMAMKADNMEEMAEAMSDAMAANMMTSTENAIDVGADNASADDASAAANDIARPKPAQSR